MNWDYFTAYCYYEKNCKVCKKENGRSLDHWVLDLKDNQHHWLENGLKLLGSQGWELVTVQQHFVQAVLYDFPLKFWYVFKKPIG